jgi:hypothetical protein
MTQSEHPWMEHAETGHRAQLPDDPYWRANGWNPVDGPYPEPDTLHDPEFRDQEPDQQPEPVKPERAKPAAKPAGKSADKSAKSEEK